MQLPKLSAPPTDFIKSMEQYLTEAPRPAEGEAHKVRGGLVSSGLCTPSCQKAAVGVHNIPTIEKLSLYPQLVLCGKIGKVALADVHRAPCEASWLSSVWPLAWTAEGHAAA